MAVSRSPKVPVIERRDRPTPVLIRVCKVRPAFSYRDKTRGSVCHSMEMTIPSEVAKMAGIKVGNTLIVEGHADGFWVRKGADLVTAEDKDL